MVGFVFLAVVFVDDIVQALEMVGDFRAVSPA